MCNKDKKIESNQESYKHNFKKKMSKCKQFKGKIEKETEKVNQS